MGWMFKTRRFARVKNTRYGNHTLFNAVKNAEAQLIFFSGHGSEEYAQIYDVEVNRIHL